MNPASDGLSRAASQTDEQIANQHLYNGFGTSFSRAFELAVTPAIFGILGHLVDRAAGTSPVFLIVFALFCVIGMGVRMYYGYVESMKEHEVAAPWGRPWNRRPVR